MTKKMNNAPLYFVLTQVRFNALLTLDAYLPTIQDALRKQGFSDFSKTMMATINLNIGVPASANQMPVAQFGRYMFLNENKTEGFLLDQSSLSFQTTRYDTFDPFKSTFLTGLRIVDEAVGGLSFSERVGLRFLDAVRPQENEKISDYLSPSVIGLSEKTHDRRLSHSICETWTKSDKSNVMCRTIIQNQMEIGVAFPPDLQPVFLEIDEKFRKTTGIYGIIDTDAWYETRQKFATTNISEQLSGLHTDVCQSFDDVITPHAIKVWE